MPRYNKALYGVPFLFAWEKNFMSDYGVLWGVTEPGCLVDSTRYNIDGTGVCKPDSILIGKAVCFAGFDGVYKMLSDDFSDTAGAVAVGIALRANDCLTIDERTGYMEYRSGDPVNVVTRGKVWALSEVIVSRPEFGSKVSVLSDGFISDAGEYVVDGWEFSGDFIKYDNQFNLVGVNLKNPGKLIAAT